jgi:hypothetical protein
MHRHITGVCCYTSAERETLRRGRELHCLARRLHTWGGGRRKRRERARAMEGGGENGERERDEERPGRVGGREGGRG